MKQHYISAKRLSLWMRLVKRWKSLYRTVAQGASETKLSKLNKLSLTLGIKRKIAIGSLATMATLGVNAQVSFERVLFGDNQKIHNLGVESSKPEFGDIDKDGDQDLVVGTADGTLHYYANENNSFAEKIGTDNPFDGIDIGIRAAPALVDLDKDGDLDLVAGNWVGEIHYYSNTGGVFTEQTGTNNPFDGITVGRGTIPDLADFDADGDIDMIAGLNDGSIKYYTNDGNNVFAIQTGFNSPFRTITVNRDASPTLIDFDGDNDLDLTVGSQSGDVIYLRNNGDQTFSSRNGTDNPLYRVDVDLGGGNNTSPVFIDFDGDNDLDLVVGTAKGNLEYYEKVGTEVFPKNSENDLFKKQVNITSYSSPVFIDLDGDNDLDLVSGNVVGEFHYYEDSLGTFVERKGTDNPFNGFDAGTTSTSTFADIDNDGDQDLISGNEGGVFTFFENTLGVFEEKTGTDNPLNGFDVGSTSSPVFVDLDGDNDLDLVSSSYDDGLFYYLNTANVFTKKTGADNPFTGLAFPGNRPAPAFADLDGDGDLDLLVGNYYGRVAYYTNDGANNFTRQTGAGGTSNPFEGIGAGKYSTTPTFADLDGDGDLDLVIGDNNGVLIEYRNTSVVGLSELVFTKKETTTVYPNPTSNQLFVETEGNYQISDATGVVLLEGKVSKNGIDVSNLNDGYYVINVEGKISSFIKR